MAGTSAGGGPGEIMLFGVRVVVDSMRKSVSLNNLSQYEQPQGAEKNSGSDAKNKEVEKDVKEDVAVAVAVAAGYGSADDAVHHSSGSRSERKRGVPWTEEEHKLFLIGLQKVGKGDWRGISRNFVKSRTPTQVASHAQKYFLRRLNINRRRRRSSLFDITTDTVAGVSMGDELQGKRSPTSTTTVDNLSLGGQGNHQCVPPASNLIRSPTVVDVPVPSLTRTSSRTVSEVDLNLNSSPAAAADPLPLSLNLSLHSNEMESTRHSGFQMMCSLSGDSSISVA